MLESIHEDGIDDTAPLLRPTQDVTNASFVTDLNESLENVCRFYSSTETKLVNQLELLIKDIRLKERRQSVLAGLPVNDSPDRHSIYGDDVANSRYRHLSGIPHADTHTVSPASDNVEHFPALPSGLSTMHSSVVSTANHPQPNQDSSDQLHVPPSVPALNPPSNSQSMHARSASRNSQISVHIDSHPSSALATDVMYRTKPRTASLPNNTDYSMNNVYTPDLFHPGNTSPLLTVTDHFASLLWQSKVLKPEKTRLKRELTHLFVTFCDLRNFIELNYTAFNKILKKYEKVTGFKLKKKYVATQVDTAYPFKQETRQFLSRSIDRVIVSYARICTDGNINLATTELNGNLRDRIVWERNTIWRDMIERERRGMAVGVVQESAHPENAKPTNVYVWTLPFVGTVVTIHKQLFWFVTSTLTFASIVSGMFVPFPQVEQNYCFAILIYASMLWSLEVIPLFVTSIMIPSLVVLLRVLRDPVMLPPGSGHFDNFVGTEYIRLDAKSTAKRIFSEMFSPVIMLLLGGFSLAAALSKHNIAKGMASFILAKAGSKPSNVILANMFVSTFASMWISNVAAPVLCFSLINPILRNLPHRSPYAKALILGIALAANVGGMASPIASPQNIVAVGNMVPSVSWLQWFMISLPVCLITDLVIWGVLLMVYQPDSEYQPAPPEIFKRKGRVVSSQSIHGDIEHGASASGSTNVLNDTVYSPLDDHVRRHDWNLSRAIKKASFGMNSTQMFIILVTVCTIVLWCAEQALESFVGDMGVIAILPMVAFFGTGILTKEDFNNFLWTVIMLAMGGISLGKAVQSSGLLGEITVSLTPYLSELSSFQALLAITGVVLVLTTFVSHTVGALILLPVIQQIGASLPDPQPRTLVMAAALMCSGAMGLPVSSFPNMNAISLEDPTGVPWLTVNDFLKVGLLGGGVAYVTIVTVGYSIMSWMNFH